MVYVVRLVRFRFPFKIDVNDDLCLIHAQIVFVWFDSVLASCAEF